MKDFYTYLPEDAKHKNMSDLYAHALFELKRESNNSQIEVECFDLVNAYTSNDIPNVHVRFNKLTYAARRERRETIEYAAELTVSRKPLEQAMISRLGDTLQAFEIRMPQGENQDDEVGLIKRLISQLKLIDDKQILDIIYHDYCDDDGIRHPYFRCYFLN